MISFARRKPERSDRMRRHMNLPSAHRLIVLIVTLVAAATYVAAQSGRRGKSKPSAPGVPSVPETQPAQPKPPKASALQLLVGVEDPGAFSGVSYYAADAARDECIRRLSEPAGVSVAAGPRRMTRSDAIKAAKSETGRYVVWLQVGNEAADSAPPVSGSSEEFYVNYFIYEPGTARVKQSGRVHYGARKVGNVGVGAPSSRRSPAYGDLVVREEAREAADRILAAFGIRAEGWPRE